jgi:RNA polymerase sigma-70 factor (ECF subfamily)
MTKADFPGQSIVVASRAEPDATPALRLDLREVFTMHASYVWNTLRRLGVDGADLEDVTHDVFAEVQRHLGEFEPARPVKPWLFGFAFRIASGYRRRSARRREAPLDAEPVDPGALADARMAADEDRRLVLEALGAIDLTRRAVFVLYELDGVPMAEIARSLDIPENTAYSRLRAARAEFAAAVKRLKLRRGDR